MQFDRYLSPIYDIVTEVGLLSRGDFEIAISRSGHDDIAILLAYRYAMLTAHVAISLCRINTFAFWLSADQKLTSLSCWIKNLTPTTRMDSTWTRSGLRHDFVSVASG